MLGRRELLQRLVGGTGVAVLCSEAAPSVRAAQRKPSPQCPRCMTVFGLCVRRPGPWAPDDLLYRYPSARVVDGAVVTSHCVTYVPVDVIATPGKRGPVRCSCGWSGTAVFIETQED